MGYYVIIKRLQSLFWKNDFTKDRQDDNGKYAFKIPVKYDIIHLVELCKAYQTNLSKQTNNNKENKQTKTKIKAKQNKNKYPFLWFFYWIL